MSEINLLPLEERRSEAIESLYKKLSTVSVVLLIATAISVLTILAFFTSLVTQRQKLITRIEESSAKVNSFKTTEELLVVTKNKVSVADKIVSSRINQVDSFKALSELVPKNVYFSDIKIAQGKLVVSGKAKSSADVAGLISAWLSDKGSKIVSDISIDTLSSSENGNYSFGLSAKVVSN